MRVLAEDDHLRGWYDVNARMAAVAVREALVVSVPCPVIAVLSPPRLGERPKPLASCDPLRGPLDHDIRAGLPAVAPGRHGHEWRILKVDVLLLTYTGAEREAPLAPDTYHGCDVWASVGAHGGQPVELGPVEQRLCGFPRRSRRRRVAEAIVDLSCPHACVDRHPTANLSVVNAPLLLAQVLRRRLASSGRPTGIKTRPTQCGTSGRCGSLIAGLTPRGQGTAIGAAQGRGREGSSWQPGQEMGTQRL